MKISFRLCVWLVLFLAQAVAQTQVCPPRPDIGSIVTDPVELHSQNGVLQVDLTMLNSLGSDGVMHYCYLYADGSEAPTLMVNPGDRLIFNLTNRLTATAGAMPHMSGHAAPAGGCAGGTMTSASTNLHFHGLNVPPKCHQDETIRTLIQPTDPPFQYSIEIPKNDPPGLYWYHPHPHGITTTQVLGGAAGALIIGGLEQVKPQVSGLTERVLIVRQFIVPPPGPLRQLFIDPDDADDGAPLSLNFVPDFEKVESPQIAMKPLEKQLWRLVNATSTAFLALQFQVNVQPHRMELVALDGVPLGASRTVDTVFVPPAGRAEFIVQGPPEGAFAQFVNLGFDTGPGGDPNPYRTMADILTSSDAPSSSTSRLPAFRQAKKVQRFAGLAAQAPAVTRNLYFSERSNDTNTQFFITVRGQVPRVYEPGLPPAITTRQGTVEDWIIENRTTEVHAFHIHQLHFLVLEINGKPVTDSTVRDTITVPYWDGKSSHYPRVKLRMDFRDPETVGTFLYHCHILDHEDGGMMAKIQVMPATPSRR